MGAPFVIYICVFYTLFTASIILHFISSRVGCTEKEHGEEEDANEEVDEEKRKKEKEREEQMVGCFFID